MIQLIWRGLARSRAGYASLVAAVGVVTLIACEQSTGPKLDRSATALGDSVSGSVTRTDTVVFHLDATAGDVFALYIQARDSSVVAQVLDPNGSIVGSAFDEGPSAMPESGYGVIHATVTGTYRLRVFAGGSSGGRFVARTERIDAAPEHAPAMIQVNDTVSTEAMDQPADVDEFTFDGHAGEELIFFLQRMSTASGMLTAELYEDNGSGTKLQFANDPFVLASGPNEDLEAGGSGRFTLPTDGKYRLRILSFGEQGYLGPYRFQLAAINRAPEHAAATITPGDTISESIDPVGDVDEFTIAGAAGGTYNVFVDASGAAPHGVIATVDTGQPGSTPLTTTAPLGTRLLDNPTGTFVMPASGHAKLTVTDVASYHGLFRGPYRVFVYAIDSAAEAGDGQLILADGLHTGSIDQYGDVDEYPFSLTTRQDLALLGPPELSGKLNVAVVSDSTGQIVFGLNSPVYGPSYANVNAGSYRLRVAPTGPGTRSTFRGAYQFALSVIDSAPESARPVLTVGDTLRQETLAWPHDIDSFQLSSAVQDTVILILTRQPNDSVWHQTVSVTDDHTGKPLFDMPLLFVNDVVQVPRIDIPAGGSYHVRIEGATVQWTPGVGAPYTLETRRVSAAPDHRVPQIAFEDTVRDAMDYYGDIDDYFLHGTPGQEFNFASAWLITYSPPTFYMTATDSATGAPLATVSSPGDNYSMNAAVPPSGVVRFRACVGADCVVPACVLQACLAGAHPLAGYWLVVHQINRAPESRNAAFSIGDTVSGESIDQPGDIDEFTFSATAGQAVRVAFQSLTIPPFTSVAPLQLELVDPTSGTTLALLVDTLATSQLDDITSGSISLSRTGTYLVRVRTYPPNAQSPAYGGPYRFRVSAVP